MSGRFFISHIFFLTAFVGLLSAVVVVLVRQHRQWQPMLLASLPLVFIFIIAYLGKHAPAAHQVANIFYNAILIYNAYYFWSSAQRLTYYFYMIAIISTGLDYAMHFVIKSV